MTAPRPPKKSETLEVRLPHAAKSAFMTRCHASGLTASEVVRTLIEREATMPRSRRAFSVGQALAAAIAGLAIGAVAAPSIAEALPGSRADFDRMDANRDGVVTFAEFQAR